MANTSSYYTNFALYRGEWECNPLGGTQIVVSTTDGCDPIIIADVRESHPDLLNLLFERLYERDALRAELDEAKAEIERLRADRPFIIGFVEGFDAAVKECEALVREKFEKCRKVSMTYTGLDAASDISDLKGTSDD